MPDWRVQVPGNDPCGRAQRCARRQSWVCSTAVLVPVALKSGGTPSHPAKGHTTSGGQKATTVLHAKDASQTLPQVATTILTGQTDNNCDGTTSTASTESEPEGTLVCYQVTINPKTPRSPAVQPSR